MTRSKKNITPFHVINWDVNSREFYNYDVMPYFVNCYQELKGKKQDIPATLDEFKKFIESCSHCRYWARCEYEVLLYDWPNAVTHKKIDVHWQVMMNLDIIAKILMENVV